jgi:parallel beta-helix repeat protein
MKRFARPMKELDVRTIRLLLLIGLVLLGFPRSACAQVTVGTCRPNLVHFDNLDDAVHGVPNGETILVCPGIYAEQISINASLTLKGIQSGNSGLPIIVPPPGGLRQNAIGFDLPLSWYRNVALAAQILVNPGATVNVSGIALDATNNGLTDCSLNPIGILYQDSSGVVDHVSAKNQINPCTFGNGFPNPHGDGVLVQSDGALPAVVTVENSSFDNVGLNGLDANGTTAGGVSLTAKSNSLVGPGNTQGNGIYISQAAATVSNNTISDALHLAEPTGYVGIISECSNTFTASNNKVSNALEGIAITNPSSYCATSAYSVTGNTVSGMQASGIEVCGPNNVVQGNTISDSGQAGIILDDVAIGLSCGTQAVTMSGNTIDRACAALVQGPANGANLIGANAIFNSKFLLLVGTSCQ